MTAHQQWLHLQLGIGNDTDIAKALAALLRVTPEAEQRLMVLAVPTWLNRLSDEPARRLAIAQQGLARAKQNPGLADNAHAVLAQLELLADQPEAAQASTRLAFTANPSSEAAALVLVALFDANRLSVLPPASVFAPTPQANQRAKPSAAARLCQPQPQPVTAANPEPWRNSL